MSSKRAAPNVQKKPRHRHSPSQLAALNEEFDKNGHPPLDIRTALAERLGMETKTVNAWFQNKRASSKKRTRGVTAETSTTVLDEVHPPAPSSHRQSELDDEDPSLEAQHASMSSVVGEALSTFHSGYTRNNEFLIDNENMARRMRMRPTAAQTDELRNLYNINPHPTTEQRQALSERIGMRYQSITNWFQNQRSLAKKRKDDEATAMISAASASPDSSHDTSHYPVFLPPPSLHQTEHLPPAASHPSLYPQSQLHRSPSPLYSEGMRRTSRRSSIPYGSISSISRPRRCRPEPYQLDALKVLFSKTATPTIEERTALALEIGMDVGKVTNWFRNLRQTARKRAKRTGSADDDDYEGFNGHTYSASASRSGTPSLRSSSSMSMDDDSMELEGYDDDYAMEDVRSELGSEEEYQEALTPATLPSPSPPPSDKSRVTKHISLGKIQALPSDSEKARLSGVKIEDALLLLSFHHHVVH